MIEFGSQKSAAILGRLRVSRACAYTSIALRAAHPHPLANPEILTRASIWDEGMRVRHWLSGNSVKLYNEHNVLRAEMTMNNPTMFRVYRHSEGKKSAKPKKLMALRKGIADIPIRTQVAANVNRRFMQHMATLHDDRPLRDLLLEITQPHIQNSRHVRALDIIGKDRELLQAIADPLYSIEGITNKHLRKKMHQSSWAKNGTDTQLSARVSRHLRLLRDYGLIRKVPSQRKYLLTAQGQTLVAALNALLAASTQKLAAMAA